jgi:hypothetical protein
MRNLGGSAFIFGLMLAACGGGGSADDTGTDTDTDDTTPDAGPMDPDATDPDAMIDVCAACVAEATCDDQAASPCVCPDGYLGDGTTAGTGCTNIDECTDGGVCVDAADGGTCEDSAGSYTCGCADGFDGDGELAGTGCTNIDECIEGGFCLDAVDHGTCEDSAGSYTCGCAEGYDGDGEVGGTGCADVDECMSVVSPCQFGSCVNTVGAFECQALFATSISQAFSWLIDPITSNVVGSFDTQLEGQNLTGVATLTQDPTDGTIYGVARVSGITGRVLVRFDTATGTFVEVGNLGGFFSSLTFRDDGQLFGTTGQNSSPTTTAETLYAIDKATGTPTLAATLGNGADGEVIVHNPDDDSFYHFSGNGTIVFEKIMDSAPYTVTNIPITGTTNGETFGAYYLGAGEFLVSNINDSYNIVNVDGTWGDSFGVTPDDLRGLVMLPLPEIVIDPATGTVAGGDTVSITGQFSEMTGILGVTVGGANATDVVQVGNTVTFVTPAGAAGAVDVVVSFNSTGDHRFASAFTYE